MTTNLDLLERVPPQSMPAEQATLGAMLLERDAIERASEMLVPEDFYREAHRVIFRGMLELFEKREPVDLITLGEWLKARGELESIGGTLYLTTLMSQVPIAAGIGHYAGIVRDRAQCRQIIKTADEYLRTAYDQTRDIDELLDEFSEKLQAIRDRTLRSFDMESAQLSRLMLREWDRMEAENKSAAPPPGILTDLPTVNGYLAPGIQPGELCVVCARPSMGKTVAAIQNIGIHAAKEKKSVLIFSLEMSQYAVARRAIAANSQNTEGWHLTNFDYRKHNWETLRDHTRGGDLPIAHDIAGTINRAWDWNVPILYTPQLKVSELNAYVRRRKREAGLDLVVIDGLWLMESERYTENENIKFGEIVRGIKRCAADYHVAIILVHQLNRGTEGRTDRRPILGDLRACGEVEQTADHVIGLYRDSYYSRNENDTSAEWIFLKERNNAVGTATVHFSGSRSTFYEAPREDRGDSSFGRSPG
jgi:replicative DNA helicase